MFNNDLCFSRFLQIYILAWNMQITTWVDGAGNRNIVLHYMNKQAGVLVQNSS